MDLNKFAKEVRENNIAHGFDEKDRSFGDYISLMHSELSEALEEHRNGHKPTEIYYNCKLDPNSIECTIDYSLAALCDAKLCNKCQYGKPEGIPIELADCVIRILDYCKKYDIDIESAMQEKHEYNKTRPYKHGGKVM